MAQGCTRMMRGDSRAVTHVMERGFFMRLSAKNATGKEKSIAPRRTVTSKITLIGSS